MSHLPYITCDNENIHPKSHSRKLTFPTICCEKCWSITNLPFPSLQSKPYRWCSGRLLTSSALDRGADLQLSQTKDITIGIWCLHTGSKSNDWLAWSPLCIGTNKFQSANSLKQQFTIRYVVSIGNTTLIPSQPVIALTTGMQASNTNCNVFGLNQLEVGPTI
jgi:hypothetical protein